jgi:anti-anti-sigma factor
MSVVDPGVRIAGAMRGDEVVITLGGEVDAATCPRIVEFVEFEVQACPTVLTIDMAQVTFVDSSGLALLVRAHRWVSEFGGRIVVRSPSPQFLRLLEITGVDAVITVEGSCAP